MSASPTTTQASSLEPTLIVIFGITGDLSQRYLLPSLYHLIKDGLLHPETEIIGVTRGAMTAEQLLDKVELCVNEIDKVCDPVALKATHDRTSMFQMNLTDPAGYQALRKHLDAIEEKKGVCMNRLYYLSIPPQVYQPVIHLLGEAKLNTSCQHGSAQTRLLVEKPFGYDLHSAQELITETAKVFREEQVFRIDHYLAKETVQNILTFRFENPIFEALWNREHISSITVSAHEKIGIEGRATFYESLGALRDFIQSHLMQIAALVTMEHPARFTSDSIHKAKRQVLQQIETVPPNKVTERAIRGQYKSYRQEVGNSRSTTETYAAVTVYIDSPRWRNVPIHLTTGKALDERKSEVCITFHDGQDNNQNHLRFRIQPNEGIELDLLTKKPGFDHELASVAMNFSYNTGPANHSHPDAYERVLVDAIRGDRTLFATSEEVIESWRILQPVLDEWAKSDTDLRIYKPGVHDLAD